MTAQVMTRVAVPDDAEALSQLHLEVARYYVGLDPGHFRTPDAATLPSFFTTLLTRDRETQSLWLVAVVEDEVIGSVHASLREPVADADLQIERDLGERIVYVDSLAVAETHRRFGVGRVLMKKAETWAGELGASHVLLDTYAGSPLSVDFYEAGLGYKRRAIIFGKRVGDGGLEPPTSSV